MALASVSLGWGDRDLCFSDNSKGLKNKEIPGIHLRWDMGPHGVPGCPVHQSCWGLAPHDGQDAQASSLRSRDPSESAPPEWYGTETVGPGVSVKLASGTLLTS